MKELKGLEKLITKQQIESTVKTKKDIEYKLDNTITPYKGHSVYEINIKTLEINLCEYVKHRNITWEEALELKNSGCKKEILIKNDCVYISALSKKSALERFNKNKGSATLPKGELKIGY